MDDIKRKKLTDLQQNLMETHDSLVDLAGAGKKRRSEQEELLCDALDSLEEAIACIGEALE